MLKSSQALNSKIRGRLLENEYLADYTSWRVGGKVDWLFIPADLQDLAEFFRHLPLKIPVTWLGLGSNVLVRDGGLEGVVVITQGALNRTSQLQPNIIRAEAGVACGQLARYTARLSMARLEFMAGIPGTVGGALAMNAGCWGGETWQYVHAVETINRTGLIQTRSPREFTISYRSVKTPHPEWFVAGHFLLAQGDKNQSLADIRVLLEKRNASQPTGLPSCGSVFRNPPGHYAARLIEECGLKKMSVGGAYISEKHANFIINDGTATANDIETLIKHVRETVERHHGVLLHPEVCIMGKVSV